MEGNAIDKRIALYSREGKLLGIYRNIRHITLELQGSSDSGIKSALESGLIYKDCFLRYCNGETPPEQIEVPWLCKIEGQTYMKQSEIVEALGLSRQLVSAAVKSRAHKLGKKVVEWNENFD